MLGIGTGLQIGAGSSSVASALSSDTTALVARFTNAPTTARAAVIDRLITDLKAGAISGSNIWAKLSGLWILAAADSQAAKLNWKGSDGSIIGGAAPAFTADRGYCDVVGAGSKYLDTGWTDLGLIGLDATAWSMGFYQVDALGGGVALGNTASSGMQYMTAGGPGGSSGARITSFGGGGTLSGAALAGARHELGSRTGSTATLYENGTSVASVFASRAFATSAFLLCNGTTNGLGSSSTIGACHVGTDLTADEAIDLYTALHAYLQAVGAVA